VSEVVEKQDDGGPRRAHHLTTSSNAAGTCFHSACRTCPSPFVRFFGETQRIFSYGATERAQKVEGVHLLVVR